MGEASQTSDDLHRQRVHALAMRLPLSLNPDVIGVKIGEDRSGDGVTSYAVVHASDLIVADRKGRMLLIGRKAPPLGLAPIGEMLETKPDGRPETALEAAIRGAREEASLELPADSQPIIIRDRAISAAAIRRVRDDPNPDFVKKYGLHPGDYFSVTTAVSCALVDDLDALALAPASDARKLVLVRYDPASQTLWESARIGPDGRREEVEGGRPLSEQDFAIADIHRAVLLAGSRLAKDAPSSGRPVGDTRCSVYGVQFEDAAAINAFFAALYEAEAMAAPGASRNQLAARLGLLARTRIVGLFKHIDTAFVVLCGLSPILKRLPFGVSDPGRDRLFDYHGYVAKDSDGRIAAVAAFERNPDPRMIVNGQPRGADNARIEASLWVLPKALRVSQGIPSDFTSALGRTLGAVARSLGYRTVEVVISRENRPSRLLAASLGLVLTDRLKRDPAVGERVVYEAELGAGETPPP